MALDLREEKIGKKEFWVYCFLFLVTVVLTIALLLGVWDGAMDYQPESLRLIDKVLGVVVSFGTLFLAYYINRKGDGKRFWYRYISLGLPIGIIMAVLGVLVLTLATVTQVTSIDYFGYTDLGLETAIYILTFYMTWKFMKIVSAKD